MLDAPMKPLAAMDRLIAALDLPTVGDARTMATALEGHVGCFKIGLEQVMVGGHAFAEELAARGHDVFLDVKLFDIEETVARATANVARMGVRYVTVHAQGPTVAAAVKGRGDAPLSILAVTVLTNFDTRDLADVGYEGSVTDLVVERARRAINAGADGIVCSGAEASAIRAVIGPGPRIITPGIRPSGSEFGDQKRVMTPARAISAGADMLVVGRPITRATAPADAADAIVREIAQSL